MNRKPRRTASNRMDMDISFTGAGPVISFSSRTRRNGWYGESPPEPDTILQFYPGSCVPRLLRTITHPFIPVKEVS